MPQYLLVRFDVLADTIPEKERYEAVQSLLLKIEEAHKHVWGGYAGRERVFEGEIEGIDGRTALVSYSKGRYGYRVSDDMIAAALIDPPAHIVSFQRRNKIPKQYLSEPERKALDEARAADKLRAERRARTVTIRAIQQLVLYKLVDGNGWGTKAGDFILTFVNKRLRKAFVWSNGWKKFTLPGKNRLEACSPLEFTVQTGTTFAKTIEEEFGLEIEGREERGEAS